MKIKIYVDWERQFVSTLDEVRDETFNRFKAMVEDKNEWNNWLGNYSKEELFSMDENKRRELQSKFRAAMMKAATEDVKDSYEEYILNTENYSVVEG